MAQSPAVDNSTFLLIVKYDLIECFNLVVGGDFYALTILNLQVHKFLGYVH